MKPEHINEIQAIIILAIGMILLASLMSFVPQDLSWYTSHPNSPAQNLIRITGAYTAGAVFFTMGYSAYAVVLFLFFWSWNKFTDREVDFTFGKLICFAVLIFVASTFFSLTGPSDPDVSFIRGGLIGLSCSGFLLNSLGLLGSLITLSALAVLATIVLGEFLISPIVFGLVGFFQDLFGSFKEVFSGGVPSFFKLQEKTKTKAKSSKPKKTRAVAVEEEEEEYEDEEDEEEYEDEDEEEYEDEEDEDEEEYEDEEEEEEEEEYEDEEEEEELEPNIKIAPTTTAKAATPKPQKAAGEYKFPSLDLLEDPPIVATGKLESSLKEDGKRLEQTLNSFGVGAKVVDIERGPAITRFELEPGPGVKVQKFTTLQDDIALAMKAPTVRIVAPIPGKSRVGIEVPNGSSAAVYLKDVLSSSEFQKTKSKLTLSLGKDIAGKAMVADLAEMPHLLIAGTTGSGKSVCVNGIIMSILLNATPDEVKFVMVDPKMVELSQYNDIPHLLCPTVTDAKKAAAVLQWVVGEMESRYKQLSKAKAKNIKGFNAKGNDMPYIVVIIDELADLMQVSAKGVEGSIARLAQLSRAVGIHLILATQRPSVNVITGVIKANFPARISFKVASKVDSRTVLDMNGAESLLGKGDMLFMQPGDAKPTRGQGNFVKDEEINSVIEFIKEQQEPIYNDAIINTQKPGAIGGSEAKDEYYEEAVRLVVESNQASVSILQRRMRLGYTRAARLIDMMEQNGIVGPYVGSKPRDIMVDREQWLLDNMAAAED